METEDSYTIIKTGMGYLVSYAFSLLSRTPRYQWGGDDPILGFDCSGFVQELLFASGELPYGLPKMSAQQLYGRFKGNPVQSPDYAKPGDLSIYGKSPTEISHIAFCLNSDFMLEAGGGDSTTVSNDQASRQNAFLKMRPIHYRKDFLCLVRPTYAKLLSSE